MTEILKKALLFITIAFAMLSCEKIVSDFHIKEHPGKLVLNGILNPDSILIVNLSRNMSIEEQAIAPPFVKNADIKLYENDQYAGSFDYLSDGYYTINMHPGENQVYQITAEAKGFPLVSSFTRMPEKEHVAGIQTNYIFNIQDPSCIGCAPDNFLELEIKLENNSSREKYYSLSVETNNMNTLCRKQICELVTHPEYNYTYDSCYCVDMDTMEIFSREVQYRCDDKIIDFFNAYGSYWIETYPGMLISEIYFKASRLSLINNKIIIKISKNDLYNNYENKIQVRLTSLSEEAYTFLNSIARLNETDMDPFAEKVTIYTNIKDGLGLFAGKTHYDTIVEFDPGKLNLH